MREAAQTSGCFRRETALSYNSAAFAAREDLGHAGYSVMNRHGRGARSAPVRKNFQYQVEEARAIQQAMVPAEALRAHSVEVECRFRPVDEVGGDFLDYFWLADQRLGFFIGDVAGKGLPAALYAALAVGILRGLKKGGEPPDSVLQMLNRRLLDRAVPNRYCAVQYALFDPASGELCFANAGLAPRPLHVSGAGCLELGDGGFPCGMFTGARYDQHTVRLAPGDVVFFSTDGLIEAQDSKGEEFGIKRLTAVCVQNKNESAGALLARAFEAVDDFTVGGRQQDDMTAAVLHRGGSSG